MFFKGTKEELNLPAGQVWAFTGNNHDEQMEEYINRSAEDAGKDGIPLLFITFPSAKDPSWDERYPGKETWICLNVLFYLDVKLASGIKNDHFSFDPYTDVCEHGILGTFSSPVKKSTGAYFGWDLNP